jgi:hypothetical protein
MKAVMKYAHNNINPKDRYIFIRLANESIGLGKMRTPYMSKKEWAEQCQITKEDFNKHIKRLAADKHIKINRVRIGSSLCSYSPIVPEYIKEHIKLKEKAQ